MRTMLKYLLAAFYAYAGYRHIVDPAPFMMITPGWVPAPGKVIMWTGLAEIAGAIALIQPVSHRLRQCGGIGLALYALCVWPANINHMLIDMAQAGGGWGLSYHIPRLIVQPIIIWLALWVGDVIDWPFKFRRKARKATPGDELRS
ncbi:hypothetical protein CP97_12905 [Aurantiacibacter atlanticus]|uniref:DoxX family protein n=1 Tax=Aurantiacibacter atlanticus TaxID=1648404 RepID=A0A0H4VEH0_9SPHN|nr:DoxX family protein [Aurantiacibacter atlanticus]AKQ42745.2 hypothetical protein CP97_12905 [Aurantiacibacter atlanticus]MDF1835392.1 DoxX family protein [Alteraurantiacibacter sp. bin_em_oilr2.035]